MGLSEEWLTMEAAQQLPRPEYFLDVRAALTGRNG
jgi:hypothetical protein